MVYFMIKMNIIKQLIKKIDDYFSRDERKKIEELKQKLLELTMNCENDKQYLIREINNLRNELDNKDREILNLKGQQLDYENQIDKLQAELYKYHIPDNIKRIIDYYDNKYPKQKIYYQGITLHTKKFGDVKLKIYIPDYIQSFRSLEIWLEERGLTLQNYLKKYKEYAVAIDELRFDIYKEFLKEKKYMLDSELWGDKEFWSPSLFSWYLRKRGKFYGDCDSLSIVLMSLFKAAGLPRLQRLVAGRTYSGYGHCTIHIFNLKNKIWLQYEPTALSPYVFDKDKDRPIAIKQVWFSADWKFAWSTMPKNDLKKKIKNIMVQ